MFSEEAVNAREENRTRDGGGEEGTALSRGSRDGEQRPGGAQGVSVGDIREELGISLCKGPGAAKAWPVSRVKHPSSM